MSWIENGTEYSFKWILNELNYGSLQKDTRLVYIGNLIKDSMLSYITRNGIQDHYEDFVFPVIDDMEHTIMWRINISIVKSPTYFASGALYRSVYETDTIIININRAEGISDKAFNSKLLEFIDTEDIHKILLHEIKHYLDKIDNIFTNDNYVSLPDDRTHHDKVKKYLSQNKEIDAYLVSVISELKRIKDQEPDITYEAALQMSYMYNQFMKYLVSDKVNKYKNKIQYFWNNYKGENK